MRKIYKEGSIVLGYVTGIKDYGIFVKIDDDVNGLIHISQIDNRFIGSIDKYVELNELIRVKILEIKDNGFFVLSIKDIDYRITKRSDSKIVETASGFKNLALHLDYWIEKEKFSLKK